MAKKGTKKKKQSKKSKQKLQFSPIFIGIFVVFIIIASVFAVNSLLSKPISPTVGFIGTKAITQDFVDAEYAAVVSPDAPEQLPKDVFIDQVLIPKLLLEREAESVKDTITAQDIELAINQIQTTQGISSEEFSAQLEQQGMTVEELENEVHTQLAIMNVLDKQFNDIEATTEEIQTMYELGGLESQGISFEEASEFLEGRIIYDKQQEAYFFYLEDLKKKNLVFFPQSMNPLFKPFSNQTCGQTVHVFTLSSCENCKQYIESLQTLDLKSDVNWHVWELDTGDDVSTIPLEKGISAKDLALFKQASSTGKAPVTVIGCSYSRTGSGTEQLQEELNILLSLLEP